MPQDGAGNAGCENPVAPGLPVHDMLLMAVVTSSACVPTVVADVGMTVGHGMLSVPKAGAVAAGLRDHERVSTFSTILLAFIDNAGRGFVGFGRDPRGSVLPVNLFLSVHVHMVGPPPSLMCMVSAWTSDDCSFVGRSSCGTHSSQSVKSSVTACARAA